MRLPQPPRAAGWSHQGVRSGFEVAFFRPQEASISLTGHTTAKEGSALWSVGYDIELDAGWRTRTVRAISLSTTGMHEVLLVRGPDGGWSVDGEPRPDLDECIDVDLESSAVTNTLPVHRIDFSVGEGIDVPAAFIVANDLKVERLEQRYTLTAVTAEGLNFLYESSTFDFSCDLHYDAAGIILTYPGIAVRDT